MGTTTTDPVMRRIAETWAKKQAAGMTLEQLGRAMVDGGSKQSAHQFLRGNDPRISSIRRFARAVNVSVAGLVR